MDSAREFTLFPDLPTELRLKVWEHAFPPRVVNIIYDNYEDRFHSFNACVPTVLHIHRESRTIALKTLKLCFGTESHEPRIYFDASKDIVLLDDYLEFPTSIWYPSYNAFLQTTESTTESHTIQRLAINSSYFHYLNLADLDKDDQIGHATRLAKVMNPLFTRFHILRDLFIVIECVDPFHKSRIRFFDVDEKHACSPICSVCYEKRQSLPSIDKVREVYPKINIHLVGGFRGASRFDLGCYDEVVEHDPGDDPIDVDAPGSPQAVSERDDSNILYFTRQPANETDVFSYDSEDDEVDKSYNEYMKGDIFQQYEYADVEETFSDLEGESAGGYDPDIISPAELQDIKEDEKAYLEKCNPPQRDRRGSYMDFQDTWVDPEYYERRMEL